jgi:hypothetical protein
MAEYKGKYYADYYGSPFDRGSADAYYQRDARPHYRLGFDEYLVDKESMPLQYESYMAGYKMQFESGEFKDWGEDETIYDSEADYEY